MSQKRKTLVPLFVLCAFFAASPLSAQITEINRVKESTQVISQIQQIPLQGIPQGMLGNARAIAIIPNVLKIGFAIAGRHGKGLVIVRNDDGTWSNPIFISLTGGGIGWQVGVQSTDVVLVFKSRESVERMLNGRFTIGVDAAVAAGPVGRQAAAATDAQLKAEILSYSRSRGLFVGVSLDGSAITVDNVANAAFYGGGLGVVNIMQGGANAAPVEVAKLHIIVGGTPLPVPIAANQGQMPIVTPLTGGGVGQVQPATMEVVRVGLVGQSRALLALVDPSWQTYLALPSEVYTPGVAINAVALQEAVNRYDMIYFDPKYQIIRNLPEFQSTYHSMRQLIFMFRQSQQTSPNPIRLSPPQIQSNLNSATIR